MHFLFIILSVLLQELGWNNCISDPITETVSASGFFPPLAYADFSDCPGLIDFILNPSSHTRGTTRVNKYVQDPSSFAWHSGTEDSRTAAFLEQGPSLWSRLNMVFNDSPHGKLSLALSQSEKRSVLDILHSVVALTSSSSSGHPLSVAISNDVQPGVAKLSPYFFGDLWAAFPSSQKKYRIGFVPLNEQSFRVGWLKCRASRIEPHIQICGRTWYRYATALSLQ